MKHDAPGNNIIDNDSFIESHIDVLLSTKLVITYANLTDGEFLYGYDCKIQILGNNGWNDVSKVEDAVYPGIMLILDADKSFTDIIDLNRYYSELQKGYYRLIKQFFTEEFSFYVITEFDIS